MCWSTAGWNSSCLSFQNSYDFKCIIRSVKRQQRSMICNRSPLQVSYFAFFPFWCLRWQPASWPRDISMVMLTESWDQRHFKAVVEHVLSVSCGWNFNHNPRVVSHNPNIDSLHQTTGLVGLDKRYLWKISFCPMQYFDCINYHRTFRIHHKNNIQGKHQPNTLIPVERYSCY